MDKIEKGFDFLGYHFSREPLCLASITIRKHVEHIHRLYEQQIKKKATSEEMALVLGQYVKRWQCWCTAGLSDITLGSHDDVLQQNQVTLSSILNSSICAEVDTILEPALDVVAIREHATRFELSPYIYSFLSMCHRMSLFLEKWICW